MEKPASQETRSIAKSRTIKITTCPAVFADPLAALKKRPNLASFSPVLFVAFAITNSFLKLRFQNLQRP
jgi:hypothetical protein